MSTLMIASIYAHYRSNRKGDDVTVRHWWKPLSLPSGQEWMFFTHGLNDKGDILFNNTDKLSYN